MDDINFDSITGEEMRIISTSRSHEFKEILRAILKAAKNGETELYLQDTILKPTTIKELTNRGFKIGTGGRYNESNVKIKW